MRRLRFALALVALALAGSADSAMADTECPRVYQAVQPYGTCGYNGEGGSCSRCGYECENGGPYYWNMCNVGGPEPE